MGGPNTKKAPVLEVYGWLLCPKEEADMERSNRFCVKSSSEVGGGGTKQPPSYVRLS